MPYATKAMAAAITPLVVALIKYATTGDLPPLEQGITIASAVVGALLVYLVPNLGRGLSGKLKALAAAAIPLAQLVLLGVSSGDGDAAELVALLDALFMALAVYALPNRNPDADEPDDPAPGGASHRNLGASSGRSSARSSGRGGRGGGGASSGGRVAGGSIDPDCGGRDFSSPSDGGGSGYGSGHGSGEGGSGSSAGGYSGDGGGSSGGGDGGGGGGF